MGPRTETLRSPQLIGDLKYKEQMMGKTISTPASISVGGVEKMLYDRKSAAYVLSISVRTLDYALARGEFDTRRIGRKTLITAGSLKRFAASNHFGSVCKPEQENRAA
jgi:hypothetical protein